MKRNDILIAGVGGQGTVLASRLLAAAAMETGAFVRTAETIGMAQRGGSVVSHVRIDSCRKSAMIPLGTADTLIALEAVEALRSAAWLKPDSGRCIVNIRAGEALPEGLSGAVHDLVRVDGTSLAEQTGSFKTLNIVLIGAAAGGGLLDFTREQLLSAMEKMIPEKYLELNRRAFAYGYEVTKK